MKDILGEDTIEDLEKIAQMQLLSHNANLVSCSCGNIMEIVPGDVDLNQKDDDGKPLTR